MEMLAAVEGGELTLTLRGELDHHGAQDLLTQLENELDTALPRRLTLDFSGVTFMDSSGIAVALRAQRRMQAFGGQAQLVRVPAQARKVFDAAGIGRLVPIRSEGEKA